MGLQKFPFKIYNSQRIQKVSWKSISTYFLLANCSLCIRCIYVPPRRVDRHGYYYFHRIPAQTLQWAQWSLTVRDIFVHTRISNYIRRIRIWSLNSLSDWRYESWTSRWQSRRIRLLCLIRWQSSRKQLIGAWGTNACFMTDWYIFWLVNGVFVMRCCDQRSTSIFRTRQMDKILGSKYTTQTTHKSQRNSWWRVFGLKWVWREVKLIRQYHLKPFWSWWRTGYWSSRWLGILIWASTKLRNDSLTKLIHW